MLAKRCLPERCQPRFINGLPPFNPSQAKPLPISMKNVPFNVAPAYDKKSQSHTDSCGSDCAFAQ